MERFYNVCDNGHIHNADPQYTLAEAKTIARRILHEQKKQIEQQMAWIEGLSAEDVDRDEDFMEALRNDEPN